MGTGSYSVFLLTLYKLKARPPGSEVDGRTVFIFTRTDVHDEAARSPPPRCGRGRCPLHIQHPQRQRQRGSVVSTTTSPAATVTLTTRPSRTSSPPMISAATKGAKPGSTKSYAVKAGDKIGRLKLFNNEDIEHPGPGFA